MSQQPRHAAPAVRGGVLVVGVVTMLGWAAGSPVGNWRALVSAGEGAAATPDFDQLLVTSAALAAWVGLCWLGIAVVLEVASTLPGAAGRGCAAVAAKTSPMLVRRIVHAVIGVSVLAGPLTAGSAFADGTSTTTSTSALVDRPNSLGVPTLAAPSSAPLALDRPATAFVPSLPPPAAKRTAAGPAALVTGVAHRDAGDRGDRSTHGYVVLRGDTLWDIAARHLGPGATAVDISRAWPAWYDANRAVIGPDPGVISPGQLLVPPSMVTSPAGTR
jgi:resuscitation-promoting factor RpfA